MTRSPGRVGALRFGGRAARSIVWFACVALVTACGAGIRPLPPRGTPTGDAPETVPVPATASDAEYFNANPLMVPVVGVKPEQIEDTFNAARDGKRIHRATDILAPMETPVVAASNGVVLRMSQNTLGGVTLYMLDDAKRFLFYYAHLARYSDLPSPGARVRRGDVLGYVGKTGNAPVPHLHFQAMRWDPGRRDYWNAAPVDVRPYFTLTGRAGADER